MGPTLLSFLTFAATLSSAYCIPAPGGWRRPPPHHELTVQQLQQRQPTASLVSNSNVTLQYVGLGVGIQNYSCSSTTATPQAIGAIATLFDITEFLQVTKDTSSTLSNKYLKMYQKQSCQANPTDLSDNSCEESINALHFSELGKHYFASINGAGVPSFDIYGQAFLSAQKVGDISAPDNAYGGGRQGFGAVDWLFLPSDGSSRSSGLSEVYRINTAGGNPDPNGCQSGESVLTYKYAAEYWFYL